MKRLGICVFYDQKGIVDTYLEVLLESFESVLDRLIVVINGYITEDAYSKVSKYSDEIYKRDNIGYDGGAYKDVFTKYLSVCDLQNCDEILVFNDTFYGPLYPWTEMFDRMEREPVAFWGISRHPGGKFSELNTFGPHIQSYFIAIKKEMFSNSVFREFWEDLEYPASRQDAAEDFEIQFTKFFSQKGFRYSSWLDVKGYCPEYNEISYSSSHVYELIKRYHMPVMKKRILRWDNYEQVYKAFDFIREELGYDITNIYENSLRLYKEGRAENFFNFFSLEEFYKSHTKVYIYGTGTKGKQMEKFFNFRKWGIAGFVVTHKEANEKNVKEFGDLVLKEDEGIVLALREKAFKEVYPLVAGRCKKSQLFSEYIDAEH